MVSSSARTTCTCDSRDWSVSPTLSVTASPAIDPLELVRHAPLRQEDYVTSIAPKFSPVAQEYGQKESLAERRFKKKMRQFDVCRLFDEGKSQQETADILKVTKRTIQRDWKEMRLSRYEKSDIR